MSERQSQGFGEGTPNHINITITNNQNQEPTKKAHLNLNDLEEKYSPSILSEALSIAKARGMEANLKYVQGICKNLMKTSNNMIMPEFNQNMKNPHEKDATWRGFLLWSRDRLTRSSIEILEKIRVEPDGRTLCILDPVPESLQMIIAKYFTEEISPPILVIFSAKSEENRTTSIKIKKK